MIKSKLPTTLILAALGLTGASVSHAASTIINVSADTYISANTGNNNGDTDNELVVGTVDVNIIGPTDYRGLIRFDLSSLSALAGVGETIVVNSVDLLGSTRSGQGGVNTNIAINVNAFGYEFVEGVASWDDPDGDGSDGTGDSAGGTLGTLLATATVADATATGTAVDFSSEAAFVGIIGSALSGDNTVNLIVNRPGDLAGANTFVRFGDEDRAGERFQLDIDYTVTAIPEPSAALLGAFGLLFLLRRRR